ncbi:MAG: CDP-glycerol glycerophosphotransferase family protein [Clostridia bacterium]|nr:CDP-glycerol glycerophosphotransferase family protein [Clostridia bacterium]
MKKDSRVKIILTNIMKKSTSLRKIARKLVGGKRYLVFKMRGIGRKVQDKTVIFFAFKGKSYACSPKAIYEYMQSDQAYQDYTYIWAFQEPEKYKFLEKNKNTKVISYGGRKFEQYLAIAKYWIFNYRVEDHIYPKKKQVYVQCWHGTPLKRLGYDLKGTHNAMNSEEEIHQKYKIDSKKFKYFISPSEFATEKFISAWNLKAQGKENVIIQEGYPRNDFLLNYQPSDIERIKEKLNLPKNKKIILYAPTWRDDQHQSGVGYTYKTEINFERLQEQLQDEYIILFRAHYLVANSFDFQKYKGFIYDVSQVDDINELYVISDILVTDYSSVFFDYANLKRPILFYMYDLKKYQEELRGFYIDLAELPGPIFETEQELIEQIRRVQNFLVDEKYQAFNKKYNYLDDGQASKRVIETIIKGEI